MQNLRLKVTIELNGNHALSAQDLTGLKPLVERGIAAALPDAISVDRIRVTRVKEIAGRDQDNVSASVVVSAPEPKRKRLRAIAVPNAAPKKP